MHITVKGDVQGIGYRFFIQNYAGKLSLTGWVRNCSNGDVECEVQGPEKNIKVFLSQLESGHSWARVAHILQMPMSEKNNEASFEITY